MNHYEEGIHQPSDKERWKEFVEKYSHSGYLVQSEFGAIDTTDDAMKDVAGGENLSYEEYLQVLFNSRNIIRHCFEYCYYSNAWCDFKGQISRFNKKKGKVIFNCIYVSVRRTMSGWILSLLKNIKWEIAYPLGVRYIVI